MAEKPKKSVWPPKYPKPGRVTPRNDLSYDVHPIGDIGAFQDMKKRAEKAIEDNHFEG